MAAALATGLAHGRRYWPPQCLPVATLLGLTRRRGVVGRALTPPHRLTANGLGVWNQKENQ